MGLWGRRGSPSGSGSRCRRGRRPGSAVVAYGGVWPGLARGRAGVLDEDVDAAALVVAGEAVVFVLLVGELGDDVPRVDQAGDLARGKKGGG